MIPALMIETLGCKLNQAESESLERQFCEAGYRLSNSIEEADIYILNTCTVTHIADRKSRRLIRWARRKNPDAFIAVTGCYAQIAPELISNIGSVDLVAGNTEKEKLVELVEAMRSSSSKDASSCRGASMSGSHSRTRSFIKIQDGCDEFCAYCIVPYARGRECSLPAERIADEIKSRVEDGYQEVVLTGTQIGTYGLDLRSDGINLRQLVQRILLETRVKRLRLSSLKPRDITPDFIELWRDPRLCRHFHLPLQSGCDSTLRRMGRRYTTSEFDSAVSFISDRIPDVALTTDIIVGFPGETNEEFEASYRFCQKTGFARLHVFPYSSRAGTSAADMPYQVDEQVKKARTARMLELAQSSASQFASRFVGETTEVLWETRARIGGGGDWVWMGLTDNYLRVYTTSSQDLTNLLLSTKLIAEHEQGMWGELVMEDRRSLHQWVISDRRSIAMSCYLRHMSDFLQAAGIEIDKSNRKRLHETIQAITNTQDERCSQVWQKLKVQLADEKSRAQLIADLKKAYSDQ